MTQGLFVVVFLNRALYPSKLRHYANRRREDDYTIQTQLQPKIELQNKREAIALPPRMHQRKKEK